MLGKTISRVRRNHGLEHATIHVLASKHTNFNAQGNSDHRGFNLNIYGNLSEADVRAAVQEAHQRLRQGESHLAIHPNCGTVLLTMATMATLAAQAAFSIEQKRQRRRSTDWSVLINALPSAIVSVGTALIMSRPLGMQLQARYTVDGRIGNLEIATVRKVRPNLVTYIFQYMLTGGRMDMPSASYRVTTRE